MVSRRRVQLLFATDLQGRPEFVNIILGTDKVLMAFPLT
jgi:hypothetical protein